MIDVTASPKLDWQSATEAEIEANIAPACHNEDMDLFFGPDGERADALATARRITKAKTICGTCPVQVPCAEYALTSPQKYGIWGGLTEEERATERRRMQRNDNQVDGSGAIRRTKTRRAQAAATDLVNA